MAESILEEMYDNNAINGGLWVEVSKALGHRYPLSVKDFKESWLEVSSNDARAKLKDLLSWFEVNSTAFMGMKLVSEIILHTLPDTVALQIIHSGDPEIERLLLDYLDITPNKDPKLEMVEALLKGTWDEVPTAEVRETAEA